MENQNDYRNSKYGFLSVVDIPDLGYCGGLLVLSNIGRPVEFHCTAPVIANRAQQILYGETLKEFLVCDHIGTSLILKSRSKLAIVLVDDRELLALSSTTPVPIVFVNRDEEEKALDSEPSSNVLEMAGQVFEFLGRQQESIGGLLNSFLQTLPATEPFERIHHAIEEAHSEAA